MELERRYQAILALFLGVLLFAGGILYSRQFLSPSPPLTVNTSLPPAEAQPITVHVAGAVERPGVYQLPAGSRMFNAVEKAVPLPDADLDYLNLASLLSDGQKVYLPRRGEAPSPGADFSAGQVSGSARLPAGKVNLNTATLAELDTLPGIGPTIARRIVDYRQQRGGFRRIEELKNVSGIGDKLFSQIKDRISVE
ncbi:MAG: helix-hairpin-helix domain-containing protein [Syntrophomonadaceae bacterium]|nr:helix-hairpin-helix domain-containing protein [Syntrophomonadaceae bacterium]